MKNEELFEVLGDIDEKYIAQAKEETQKRKHWKRFVMLAACLCLVVGGIGFGWWKTEHPWRVEFIQAESTAPEGEIAYIPKWEDMTTYERFGSVEWNGENYHTTGAELDQERLGSSHGTVTLYGYDVYTEQEYSIEGEVFSIPGITPEYAIAVVLDDVCYVYVDVGYKPETLGQFVETVSLREHIIVDGLSYRYKKPSGGSSNIRFEGWEEELLWELLRSNEDAENHGDVHTIAQMSFRIDAPIFGRYNIVISLSEDGYLWTNLLSNESTFYIGEERVQEFVDYVLNTYEGKEIIYIDTNAVPIPE